MNRYGSDIQAKTRGPLWDVALAVLVFAVSLGALLASDADFGMVWDEGHTIHRERTLAVWFSRVFQPEPGKSAWEMFTPVLLDRHWPFSREEPDGHPPFYAELGLLGWWAGRGWLPPLSAYRLGPMVLSSLTVGLIFLELTRRCGRLAGFTAAFGLLLMPRVFAHARYAHYDMPMTCLWLLAQIAFARSLESRRWIVPFGVLTGLAAGTKFTGWFAPVAPMLWVMGEELLPAGLWLARGEWVGWRWFRGLKTLLLGGMVAGLTVYAIQPHWWFQPVEAIRRFLVSNTTRDVTKPIPTLYLGEIYEFSLPWHNTIVLTAVTTPVLLQILAVAGLWACFRGGAGTRALRIWPASWLVLMVVRALPNAPGHDGIRLFLPSIASLAILAGLGAAWLREVLARRRLGWAAWIVVLLALGECGMGLARVYPYALSYYNMAIGGLRGAERLGFELTYYWDTIGPEFQTWVRREAPRRPLELRFPSDLVNIPFYREWGFLPADVPVLGLETVHAPDYVVQRRRGVYYPYDMWLEQNGRPWFTIEREQVELLRVYPYQESLRAYEATRHLPTPSHLRH